MGTLYPRTEDVSTNMASLRDAVPPLKTFRQTWRPYEDAVPPTEDVSTNMASLRDTVPRLKTFRQTLRPQGMRSTRTAMSNAHCLLPTPNSQLPTSIRIAQTVRTQCLLQKPGNLIPLPIRLLEALLDIFIFCLELFGFFVVGEYFGLRHFLFDLPEPSFQPFNVGLYILKLAH